MQSRRNENHDINVLLQKKFQNEEIDFNVKACYKKEVYQFARHTDRYF